MPMKGFSDLEYAVSLLMHNPACETSAAFSIMLSSKVRI